MTSPYERDRRPQVSRSFLPLALITVGVVFLLGNLLPGPGPGGLVPLGLGAAFLIGRLTTGRYGYAVPAGILLSIGTYVSLQGALRPQALQGSGWFFLLLGLGFGLVYLIGMRPSAVWPLFPATILVGLGVVLFGFTALAPIASLAWIVSYWPVALVLTGLWLLFREHLPVGMRQPVASLGGMALLLYGVLAAVASVAAGGMFVRNGFAPNFGTSAFTDTLTFDQPLSSGGTFTLNNSAGRTTIHGTTTGNTLHVTATRHASVAGEAPDVRLRPGTRGVTLDATDPSRGFPFGHFGAASWVDYEVEVPASAQVRVQASSGSVEVDDIAGAVQVDTSSGGISLQNIAGELKVSSSSGSINGTGLAHIRTAESSSGSQHLAGVFSDAAQVRAASGSIELDLLPGSNVQLDVRTGSGGINAQNPALVTSRKQDHALTASVGTPASGAVLSIQTGSGSVTVR